MPMVRFAVVVPPPLPRMVSTPLPASNFPLAREADVSTLIVLMLSVAVVPRFCFVRIRPEHTVGPAMPAHAGCQTGIQA